MPGWLGPWEIIIVVVIILLVFGGKLIPRIGRSLGRSLVGLKKGLKEGEEGFRDAIKDKDAATTSKLNAADDRPPLPRVTESAPVVPVEPPQVPAEAPADAPAELQRTEEA